MKRIAYAAVLALFAAMSPAYGAGLDRDANFMVSTDSDASAQELLALCGELRESLAVEWFGERLPDGQGRVIVYWEELPQQSRGRSLLARDGSSHMVWLYCSREKLRPTLAHELTHCILATRYPDFPQWAHEGAASQADDAGRKAIRARIVDQWERNGNLPSLEAIASEPGFSGDDQEAYTKAALLTERLVAQRGKVGFVRFVAEGRK